MNGGEAIFSALDSGGTGPGWKWDEHLETWMGLRWCLYGSEIKLLGPGWRWDVTWMEVRCKYRDLDWRELRPGWMPDVNLTPCRDDFIPPPSWWQIAPIKVPIIASQIYSVPISMPPRYHFPPSPISPVSGFLSQLYPCITWPPSRSLNYHLSSIHVAFHSIQALTFASHLHQGWVSPTSSCDNAPGPIQVPSQFQPGRDVSLNTTHVPFSSPSKPQDSCLTYIHVMSHLNPCPHICDSFPPRWRLSSIQVPKIACQFHPLPISNLSKPQDVHLTPIKVLFHFHLGPENTN